MAGNVPAPHLPRPPQLSDVYLKAKVAEALAEDLGPEDLDLTTLAVVDPRLWARAEVRAGKAGVLAGSLPAQEVFRQVDPEISFELERTEGCSLEAGDRVAQVSGRLGRLLGAERTALNFLQQLSGVATLTRRYVEAAATGGRAVILDTRKSAPGLRALQRHAVLAGGGRNHRYNLAQAILIKDNHVVAAGGVAAAIARARSSGHPVEVEVDDLGQLEEALEARADAILLDNMAPEQVVRAVALSAGRAVLEVSGGVTLDSVGAYAATGVDRISIGALTHSAPALDLSMEVVETWRV